MKLLQHKNNKRDFIRLVFPNNTIEDLEDSLEIVVDFIHNDFSAKKRNSSEIDLNEWVIVDKDIYFVGVFRMFVHQSIFPEYKEEYLNTILR